MSIPEVWTKSPAMYQKLQELLKGGKFYEALQVYMTQINRSSAVGVREASKLTTPSTCVVMEGQQVPCYTLVPSGAKSLSLIEDAVKTMFVAPSVIPVNVDSAYVSSRILAAEELITLYITTLEKLCPFVLEQYLLCLYDMIDSLSELSTSLASALGVTVDFTVMVNAAYSLTRQAIKHSMTFPIAVSNANSSDVIAINADTPLVNQYYRHGYTKLQQLAANIKEDDQSVESIFHWTRANNAKEHLQECLKFLNDSDEDFYTNISAQIVLEYLSVENVAGAVVFYNGICTRPVIGTVEKQIMEFIKLVMLAVRKDAKEQFKLLLQHYRRALNSRDEKYRLLDLAQEVGNVFFELPPPASMMEQVMSMAQGMMGMFGGAGGMGNMLAGM